MKSVLIGIIAAASLAAIAAFVLNTGFQQTATEHFQTEGARL